MVDRNVDVAYLLGGYDICRLLLTSVRMYRPQREVIEEQAYRLKNELERLGVEFKPSVRKRKLHEVGDESHA